MSYDIPAKKSRGIPQINFFITLIGFLDTHLLIPVIALYAAAMGAGVGTIGLIVGLYSVTNTLMNLLGGRLVDRFSYKPPLVAGLVGDALAMFAYTLCQLPWHLALVRLFHGSSGGLVGPATMSVVARHSSPSGRGKAMSLYGMAIALSTLIGYGGGGVIASGLGYEYVFYLGALLLIIAVALAGLMPKEILKEAATVADKASWRDILKEVMRLLRNRNLKLPYCSIFAQYFAFGGIVTLLPLYLASLDMTAIHVGMLLAIFSLMFILVQIPGGHLADNMGRLKPATLGLALATLSVVTLPLPGVFGLIAINMAIFGIGYGLLFPSISAMVADFAGAREYGQATGIFHALITVGVSSGAPIMGWVASFSGTKAGLSLSGIALFIALTMAVMAGTGNKQFPSPS